jgi:RNA polymerase sigma factor (sigma-70 family)
MVVTDGNTEDYPERVKAAAKIFDEYGDFIEAIIGLQIKDKGVADDLYQDFFLSLVARPIPASTADIRAYIFTALGNDIRDVRRRAQGQDDLMKKYYENLKFLIDKQPSTNAFIINGQDVLNLMRGRLSPINAKVIALRYLENCSVNEIAKRMGIKNETVYSYISNGLKEIRKILSDGENSHEHTE